MSNYVLLLIISVVLILEYSQFFKYNSGDNSAIFRYFKIPNFRFNGAKRVQVQADKKCRKKKIGRTEKLERSRQMREDREKREGRKIRVQDQEQGDKQVF